jgi:hypothetical protein
MEDYGVTTECLASSSGLDGEGGAWDHVWLDAVIGIVAGHDAKVCVCVFMYVCMYVYRYVCMYEYIYSAVSCGCGWEWLCLVYTCDVYNVVPTLSEFACVRIWQQCSGSSCVHGCCKMFHVALTSTVLI